MAMRMVARRLVNPTGEALFARSVARREMSSGSGKMFHEEEKAAENIYIKVCQLFSFRGGGFRVSYCGPSMPFPVS